MSDLSVNSHFLLKYMRSPITRLAKVSKIFYEQAPSKNFSTARFHLHMNGHSQLKVQNQSKEVPKTLDISVNCCMLGSSAAQTVRVK